MTGDSKPIEIILSGFIPKVKMWREILLYIITSVYIKDKYMMCHLVRHSRIQPIYFESLFNIKVIINKLEYSLNVNDKA